MNLVLDVSFVYFFCLLTFVFVIVFTLKGKNKNIELKILQK